MPRAKPKIRQEATSTAVILSDAAREKLAEMLTAAGYAEEKVKRVVRDANSAAVNAYILSKEFQTIGEEIAWYQNMSKKLDVFESGGFVSLAEQADPSDKAEIAEIAARTRKLRDRFAARIERLESLNKQGRPEGRSVLAEELVWSWNVHFDEMPKYPPEGRSGRVSPFLALLNEAIQIAEGLTPDEIDVESLRPLCSEAIAAYRKRVAQESQYLE